MIKNAHITLLIFFFSGFTLSTARSADPPKTPNHENTNVILISIDTLRHDHLGVYGYKRDTSPNIDRLAKDSVVFENFITQANLTPVSQMSIFTSQYPRMNGMVDFIVDKNEVASKKLPGILKSYDYFNAAFLSSPEFYWDGKLRKSRTPLATKNIFSEHFDVFTPADKFRAIPQKALEWVRKNKDKKFFLWIPIGTAHWPYASNVPESLQTMFDPKNYSPFFLNYGGYPDNNMGKLSHSVLSRIYKENYYLDFKPVHHLSKKDKEFIISRYDAGIHYTDQFIGELISALEKNSLADNTMIILHSIHGEDLGEHGYFHHYDLYDTEVKNALIVKFPDKSFKGNRVSAQVQGIDIAPTLLDYLGIPLHHEFQGQSLMPLIGNVSAFDPNRTAYTTRTPLWEFMLGRYLLESFRDRHDDMFTEKEKIADYSGLLNKHFGVYPEYHYPPYDIALRTDRWKLILRKDRLLQEEVSWWGFISNKKIHREEVELYDLKADPYEQRNVAASNPAVVETLTKNLMSWDDNIEKRRKKSDSYVTERVIIPYP